MVDMLRAGVVGAGVFGGYHAEKYARAPDVALTAVLDSHPERARALADRHGVAACADLADLMTRVDVVSVTAPACAHASLALASLRAGKPVYVEKPIATSLRDADAIVATGRARGLVVACGFLERALFRAMGLFDAPETPLRLEAVRRGPSSPRGLDVSVIVDLMIHDLDLALVLARAPVLAVEAEGAWAGNDLVDEATAELMFEDGFTARLSASRASDRRERTMRLVYPSGEVVIDFLAHSVVDTTPFGLNGRFAESEAGRDRLGASLEAFLAAVRGDGPGPLADGDDGVRALDLALAVEQAIGG